MPDPGREAAFFAYGTLQFARVLERVVGRPLAAIPARLEGYARFRVHGRTFPGLIAEDGALTRGMLYRAIDPSTFERLDRFEDEFYERRELTVVTDLGESIQAFVYVVPENRGALLSDEPWDEEQFLRAHLNTFLGDRNLLLWTRGGPAVDIEEDP